MSKSPVAIIILDGFGWREDSKDNAVAQANKPNFDRYWNEFPHNTMQASGLAVGLPEGQMGNSEVGHTNIGAGRVVYQSITRIDKAIQEGEFENNEALDRSIQHAIDNDSALHLFGLVSDGGVHSHQNHLYEVLRVAKEKGLDKVYIHAVTDGRDVSPDSAKDYIAQLEQKTAELGSGQIATISGRFYAMDRDNRWEREQKAYDAMVKGVGNEFEDPVLAVQASYDNDKLDEFIEPIVITNNGQPVGKIKDGDSILVFNFRADRSIQMANALTQDDFDGFDRGDQLEDIYFTTITELTGVDSDIMFPPVELVNVLGQVLSDNDLKQLRIAETEKYPHVTFFMNGGSNEEFPGESRTLIPSPKVETYDLKPEMSAYEVADSLVADIEADKYDAIILNFANPDMVGHSGRLEPTIKAIEAVDENLGRVVDAILAKDGKAIIFADHGNADTMAKEDGSPHTAHTTVPVPVIVTEKGVSLRGNGALCDVAPTMLDLLGVDQPEEMTGQSLIIKD